MEISQKSYLNYLNQVFPHWGNNDVFKWHYKNEIFKTPTDIFVLTETNSGKNEIAAGSTVVYREMDIDQKTEIKIGIMSGSWTLPEYRGKGFFTKTIEKSLELTRIKNADALCAFVTEANASSRRLIAAGSIVIPTFYIFYEKKNSEHNVDIYGVEKMNISNIVLKRLFYSYQQYKKNKLCFSYDFNSFVEQFINRPQNIYLLKIKERLFIIEENADTIKVLFAEKNQNEKPKNFTEDLLCLGLWASGNCNRKLYYFTTNEYEKELLLVMNFNVLGGYFTILPSQSIRELDFISHSCFEINLGDKM